ncbi:MAG TPA: DNA repair protein RecN, partial [Gemmataceae bacterium]|nr:DNA repair protein RecN [Gemmataceae bacterium]
MLRELAVQNLALIEDVRVELEPGFCAWTGETGAGKTLLLSALGLLLGERGSTDLLRAGAEELRVTGRFEVDQPELRAEVGRIVGGPLDDGEVLLGRRLNRHGRSYAYVNDQPVAVATLRQLGTLLVDVHGQRETHSLLQPGYQLELLDAYGQLGALRQSYLTLADLVRELRRQHAALSGARQQRQRDLALLRFERDELDAAALKPGELAGLAQERERLVHAQSLQAFAAEGCGRLYDEEGSVVEQVGRLQREAESWADKAPALAEVARRLEGVAAEVQDLAETLRDLGQRWEADPARLEEVETRLQLLRRLEAKYGRPADELIAYRATLDEQERRLQQQEDDLAGVESELKGAFARLREAARELSKQRQRVARKLAAEAQKHLADLGMAGAKLDAVLETEPLGDDPLTAEVPAWGADHLELTLAANRGEPALPLRKVASGGELSRTLLALK